MICPFQVGLLFFGVITFFPLVVIVNSSFKNNTQFYQSFWGPALPLHFVNYAIAFDRIYRPDPEQYRLLYPPPFSLLLRFWPASPALSLPATSFRASRCSSISLSACMMVPGVLTLAPRFVLVRNLGILNQPLALIVPWTSTGLVLSTWLMRSYFESIPQALFDAAKVDGAADRQVFAQIALPLARPDAGAPWPSPASSQPGTT